MSLREAFTYLRIISPHFTFEQKYKNNFIIDDKMKLEKIYLRLGHMKMKFSPRQYARKKIHIFFWTYR